MAKRAVLYARVSSDDRDNEGRNLKGQLKMGRESALENGWEIVAELAEDDRGASGADIDLPQLTKALDMAEAGEFDVLVVREMDRLSRSLPKQLFVENELNRAGVKIKYVLYDYPDTIEGQLMKNIRAVLAEYERLKIGERMTRGRRQKVESGSVVMFSRPPYGYRIADVGDTHLIIHHVDGEEEEIRRDKNNGLVTGKRLPVPHEPEARIIRLMFQWYTVGDGRNGPASIREIARRLNADGIPTWGEIWSERNFMPSADRHGTPTWGPSTVGRMLKNETYAGVWHYGNEAIPVEVPAIISRETWDEAQRRRGLNQQNSKRRLKYRYLLRRRLTCPCCNSKMVCHAMHGGKYKYYRCDTYMNVGSKRECDATHMFRAEPVDSVVWSWVRSLLTDQRALEAGLEAEQDEREKTNRPLKERLDLIDALIADNQAKLERAVDLYLTGDFSRKMLQSKETEIRERIVTLQREQKDLTTRIGAEAMDDDQVERIVEFTSQVRDRLKELEQDFDARRRLIELLDVQATLSQEGENEVVRVRCNLGQATLCTASTCTSVHAAPPR